VLDGLTRTAHITKMKFAPAVDGPYYAVILTSQHSGKSADAYMSAAKRMLELAREQPGYLGVEAAHQPNGYGITVSYWSSLEAIQAWRENGEHTLTRERGRGEWYAGYELRVAKIEYARSFRAGA
jgi:heme-degrading monooxygenase HmoA